MPAEIFFNPDNDAWFAVKENTSACELLYAPAPIYSAAIGRRIVCPKALWWKYNNKITDVIN